MQSAKFHNTLKKTKLKTFTDLNKNVKASNNQEGVIKAERKFFAQMIVIAEGRKMQMKSSTILSDQSHWHWLSQKACCARRINCLLPKELQKNIQKLDVMLSTISETLSSLVCGWCTEDGRLAIDWMGGLPVPKAVLELLFFQCSRSSKFPTWQMA